MKTQHPSLSILSQSLPRSTNLQQRSAVVLPTTVNFHILPWCNYGCRYCYAPFLDQRLQTRLPVEHAAEALRLLSLHDVRRITFAGGEPTLHPDLKTLLRASADFGMVNAVVTNGSRVCPAWLADHGPFLRWLALSIDSVEPQTAALLGRRQRSNPEDAGHLARIVSAFEALKAFNDARPPSRQILSKLNVTVTGLNANEDPTAFILACAPKRVKLLQMLLVKGENDGAADLVCSDSAFRAYAERLQRVEDAGIHVVAEDEDLMDGSYAMVDPLARFYQRVDGRYVYSRPILDVGVADAWKDVGGFSSAKFQMREGQYEAGAVATGNPAVWIAVEGLDGSGKSTAVNALAKSMHADIVTNPPASLRHERAHADSLPVAEKRAWYLRANQVAALQAQALVASGRPVVMDRSVASTLAFGAAEAGLTATSSQWPGSIARPDLIVLLDVPEDERRRRILSRCPEQTREEHRLMEDGAFRERVLAGYEALGARCVAADGAVEETLARIRMILNAL